MDKNAPAGNRARPNPLAGCPLAAAFGAIGGRWKLTILYWLAHGELHFAGVQRRAAPISHKVLAAQLRELEADGLVDRIATGPVPARVIYQLSAYGRSLLPVIEAAGQYAVCGFGSAGRWRRSRVSRRGVGNS